MRKDERGVVAIIVTVFFMMVLTLIVLAFSQAARREQRQSLDNQLQKQAFYAAESGINDAKYKIDNNISPYNAPKKTDCADSTDKVNLTTDGLISYSCVLYNKTPSDVSLQDVGTSQSETVSLKTSTSTLKDATITWRDASGGSDTSFTGCPAATETTFSPATTPPANCDAGMLKVVLMPFEGGATRGSLVSKSFTVFLRPVSTGGQSTVAYAAYGDEASAAKKFQGQIIPVSCTDHAVCSLTITGLPNVAGTENYINLRSIDKANSIKIAGTTYGGTAAEFTEAQVEIDVTGKANDVLRRLQVRKPAKPEYDKAPFALEVLDGICKQLELYPGQGSDPYTNCYPTDGSKGPAGIN